MRMLFISRCVLVAGIAAFCSLVSNEARAQAVVRAATGANTTDLQSIIQQFMIDLGGVDNGEAGGPFPTGFRSATWDGLPLSVTTPNAFDPGYYAHTSPKGLLIQTPGSDVRISAPVSNPSMTPILFGDIDPSYASTFQSYSSGQVLGLVNGTTLQTSFVLPSDGDEAAWVKGLGLVFSSVDSATSTSMEFFDQQGNSLGTFFVPAGPTGGLSFLGVSFSGDEQVWSVTVNSGNAPLGPGVVDGGLVDLVVMDNFFLGEPQVVPEPSVWALGALAFLLCGWRGRRKSST